MADPNDWPTPQKFFDALDEEFRFTLDVCASTENAKCDKYYTLDDDGLAQEWSGACWMNPPYAGGIEIARWVQKAYESSQRGATVVCLLPVRADTRWWHDYALKGEIRWIRGRLRFGGKFTPTFASCVVVFRPPITE